MARPVASLVGLTMAAITTALDRGREITWVGRVEWWICGRTWLLHRSWRCWARATVLELPTIARELRCASTGLTPPNRILRWCPHLLRAGARGRVGVLGPMRMDYKRSIRVVEEVSDALGDSLNH
jgi:hypothetical protein